VWQAHRVDSHRAAVECFSGRPRRAFTIIKDEGFRLDDEIFERQVILRISLTNECHSC
jgi:hypothetical protein